MSNLQTQSNPGPKGLANEQNVEQLIALFKLLSDRTRLQILLLLAAGERNVTSLCEELQLPQPTVSHHLGLLRLNSVIANRRSGKQVFYSLNGRVDLASAMELKVHVDNYVLQIIPREKLDKLPNG